MTYCISKNKTKQNRFPSNKMCLYMCVCACVCMCLSGPRPVASQMGVCEEDYYCKPALPTHTVSKTYIHKTHFPHHPTPIRRSLFDNALKKSLNVIQNMGDKTMLSDTKSVLEAGLKCRLYTFSVSF